MDGEKILKIIDKIMQIYFDFVYIIIVLAIVEIFIGVIIKT